jgi:lipoprotein-releasing system permease protein
MNEPTGTHPFAPFEWMLSLRYLRARRQEGFISVNAGFSFLGIMLGVATLIIVMAVMNGFRKELLDKILGLNGHLLIQPLESPLTDWEVVAARISRVPGVKLAAPIVEGQALASSPFSASGVLVRGVRAADLGRLPSIANNIRQGSRSGAGSPINCRCERATASRLWLRAARSRRWARRRVSSRTRSRRCSRLACRNTIPPSCSCRCRNRRPISTAPAM